MNPRRFRGPTLHLPDDPATIGYIAGLIDGEGSITKSNGGWRIQIAMTDKSVIDWLGDIGGTVRERKVVGNRKPVWRWLVMRQIDVRDLLVLVLPLLRVKQVRAVETIAEIEALNLDELFALERAA